MGIKAWFSAAEACGWRFAVSDETLALEEVKSSGEWTSHPLREKLGTGHLPHSMRFYRNGDLERWADHLLHDRVDAAVQLALELDRRGDTVWLTRSLSAARRWVRERRVGQERAGIIASGQARRLAAVGLFVDLKPDIAAWMLAPSGDVRSANMLESVQNQYQVQGLELDYTVVCWDGDLRRCSGGWQAWKMNGPSWQRDKALDIATNVGQAALQMRNLGVGGMVRRTAAETARELIASPELAAMLFGLGAVGLAREPDGVLAEVGHALRDRRAGRGLHAIGFRTGLPRGRAGRFRLLWRRLRHGQRLDASQRRGGQGGGGCGCE
jgi:hypothetical protein